MSRCVFAKLPIALFSCALLAAGCNYFQEKFGPPAPQEQGFQLLGPQGTPFSAIISDLTASWQVQGAVPLEIVVLNGTPQVRMVVTKLRNDSSIISVDALSAGSIVYSNSESLPFSTTQLQLTSIVPTLAPPANPDIRYLVLAPYGMNITGTIEDQNLEFQIAAIVPVLFIFENPVGATTGQFTESAIGYGPMTVQLFQNGKLTKTVVNGPNVRIP